MELLTDDSSTLVVRHTTTRGQILWFVAAVLGIAYAAPRVSGGPAELAPLLALAAAAGVAWGIYSSRCSEVYRFDKQTGRFSIERHSPLGVRVQEGPLSLIREVLTETGGADDDRALVTLVLAPDLERIQLPRRVFTFSSTEQTALAERLTSFLGLTHSHGLRIGR